MKRISHFLVLLLCALLLFSLFSCGECEHGWNEATCTTAKTCTKCGITEGSALGHNWAEATCTTAKTCTRCGITEGAALGHSWKDATCTTAKTCTRCSITEGDPLPHTFGEWIVDREATETENGAKHRVCSVCGKTETAEIAKLSHTHKYSTEWSYDDSYHWHDSTCGHDPIDKAAHLYGNWIVDAEPTEEADGAKHRVCSVCGKSETAEIAKLSHTHKYSTEWSYDDSYHWHASTCGHNDAVADKAPHDFGDTGICACGAKDASIAVTVYIDGVISDTLHTGKAFGYRITPPEKPEDITTNPNSEKYFYAWFVDANFQTPLFEETEFRTNGAIYGKWVTVYSSDFKYTVSEGKATITSLSVAATSTTTLVIPAYINGFPVVAIGDSAFSGNTFIRTLILCNGIQTIGASAFSGCNSITHLELPKSLTAIGNNAFENCSTLTELLIPENVTSIGNWAFRSCTNLANVAWNAENCTSAGASDSPIFSGCTKLETVTFGEKVKCIPSYAFYSCAGLTSITIPESVTSIGNWAFRSCTNLVSIAWNAENCTSAGSYNCPIFNGCTKLTTVTFGEKVKCIPSYAFYGCADLTSITIPESVTSIGNWAFRSCTNLVSIAWNAENCTSTGSYNYPIFNGCTKLATVTFGEKVKTIPSCAFSGCTGLTSIMFPNSVTAISGYAFMGCTELTNIYITDLAAWCKISGLSNLMGCGSSNKNLYLSNELVTELLIPDGVTSIGSYAFSYCTSLTDIEIPENVTSIGSSAFYGCTRLTSVAIPNSVTSIGSSAFSGCSGLTSIAWNAENCTSAGSSDSPIFSSCAKLTTVTFGEKVKNIPYYAFYGCSGLTSITISNSVTTIGYSAFYGCTSLTSIEIPNSVTTIGYSAFEGCTSLASITIPSNVTTIDPSAFYGCISLTSIEIPNSVTTIGYSAFEGCTSLASITIPNSVTTIGYSAFEGCTSLASITIPNSVTTIGYSAFEGCTSLASITIPSNVTTIDPSAFYGCTSLTSIEIPNSVTTIGYSAFEGCTSLASITIPNSVTTIGYSAFSGCTGLTSIEIPDRVTSIGASAFEGCTSLASITIPNSVTTIGYSAFSGCTGLTSIEIPDRVTTIGYSAFEGCTSLTSIEIPNSVTTIGYSAFEGCTSLTSIEIPNSVTTIGYSAFEGCTSLASITIPNSVTSIGSSAFSGCSRLSSITLPFVGGSRKTSSNTYQYPFGYIFGTSSYSGSIATYQSYYGSLTSNTTSTTYYLPASLKSVTITGGEILYGAFYNCGGLTSIEIPGSVTTIGSSAFSGCSGLTSITIPNSVTSIGDRTFSRCSGIVSIQVASENRKYHSDGNCLIETATKTLVLGCKNSVIPPNGNVTTINSFAFSGCTGLTSITIPNSVTTIGSSAFSGCSGLTSVTLPFVGGSCKSSTDTYRYLFGYIFGTSSYSGSVATEQYYYNTSYTYYLPASLKSVTITGGEILYGAFYNCENLTSITIGNGVTTIGDSAFSGCTGLTSIEIPSSVTTIGYSAFSGCTNLVYNDYQGGKYLENSENPYLVLIQGTATSGIHKDTKIIYSSAFKDCTSLTSIEIPNSVTSIGSRAFYGCTSLTSVTIPSSVTEIGNSAFSGCTNLVYNDYQGGKYLGNSENPYVVLIKGTATSGIHKDTKFIYDSAFKGYTSLKSITIPDSVITIGTLAFSGCTRLASITIPSGVTKIGNSAFFGCSGLTSITLPFVGATKNETRNTSFSCIFDTVPTSLKTVIITGGTNISNSAFKGCTRLTSITIPSSVTAIGDHAFYGCTSLTSVEIPNSVTKIGAWAFEDCKGLTSITIPESVTSIGSYAFSQCYGLKNIYYTGTVSEWNVITKGSGWNEYTGNYTIHYNYKPESDEG